MTGSAHCALAPYWFEQLDLHYLGKKTEKTISGYQASSRGGVVILEMTDNGKRVLISGSSVTVLKSKLLI